MQKKYVLITGSSKGLGKELALEFVKQNYGVILHGRDITSLEAVKNQITSNGVECEIVGGDINSEITIAKLFDIAKQKDIEILVNNSGVYLNKPTQETSEQEYRQIMETNFFAPIILTQKILPIFLGKSRGLIININSVAGKQGSPGEAAYAASKHAMKGHFDSLKFDVTSKGIRIVNIFPGAMNTQMSEGRKDLTKCMQIKEVAEFICHLCSKEQDSFYPSEILLGKRKF